MSGEQDRRGVGADEEELVGKLVASLREYAVYTLDPDGVVSSWNPGAERITGASAAEVVGENISVFYTTEQVAAGEPQELLHRAVQRGSCVDEGWRIRKDGTRFWANVVTTALWSSGGELRGFVRVTRDDTELHSRLESSLRQFRDLFGIAPVGIGVFDRYGYALDTNHALCELLGYEPAEIRGTHLTNMVHPDTPGGEGLRESFRDGIFPDRESVQEWPLIRADGTRVICELHMAKSVRSDGEEFWLVIFQDVTERHRTVEEWRYWATHDELTGLPNRSAVTQWLADTDMDRFAMLYCDITNFRRINESLGLKAGDDLLVEMAKRLRNDLPEEWLVGRMAADEYLIVCPDVVAAGGVDRMATFVLELFHKPVYLRGHPPIQVSASVGAAVAESNTTVEDLLRSASAAVMDAKSGGKNRVAVADPELITSMDRQLQLESELRSAIEAEELTLHYQPILDETGRILAAEALVRWDHPELGLLLPGRFLPVAARGDLIRDLDLCVLRSAMRDAATWPVGEDGRPVVTFNLGELSPADRDFVEVLGSAVAETGVDWERIVIELVETSLINITDRGAEAMHEVTGNGARFALDDFGTGYSSLDRLKEFPIGVIKIDRSFVAEITNPSGLSVVKAIADLAEALGCTCTAEGVETVEQFEALRGMGVRTYQGWLFSRAVSSSELRELLGAGALLPPGQ
ncbi:diguanylate cyclase (GGDEF)-like protein/PAS domain S-box-containing protein [Actinopolyspora biskrensis]|uniref:Diguanylate cyclase (GGDEF)-like protein/PAS domain S-box-containing protein n=1 Tax=Actinopolyspora biskrensis TaxID=1470178 RepID=A0A852Z2Q5_9ACTN|nr:EAL domain-containing protein [Actinopolyspora biskrensis]NYH79545.1 diguanylate cyclase (GGDEF)-like protein/PAS domain S-box-containing protein [Actinopolyspora biskrensis]